VAEPSILHSKLAIFHELFGIPEEGPSSPPTANTFVTTPQPLLSPAPSERHSTRSNSLPLSVDTTFMDHDFPPTPESPCAVKDRSYSHRQQIHKDSSPVKLDFGRKMGKTAAPEYSPPHRWTYKERELDTPPQPFSVIHLLIMDLGYWLVFGGGTFVTQLPLHGFSTTSLNTNRAFQLEPSLINSSLIYVYMGLKLSKCMRTLCPHHSFLKKNTLLF
jgi:hypothetical protein